jgi:hypothetical protein
MFWYVLGNEQGQPSSPPEATQVLTDTRLQPNERREIQYDIPAANVVLIRAEALYNLLLPPQVKMLGDKLPPELKKPKLAALTEARL